MTAAAPESTRGFALLLVLWTLVLVSLIVSQLLASGRSAVRIATNLRAASVAEAAAVGKADELKGQALVVFVTLKSGQAAGKEMKDKLTLHIDREIGKFARPDQIRFTDSLPKTRSGKIMRRLLKEVASGSLEMKGDTSTLEDYSVIAKLRADEE